MRSILLFIFVSLFCIVGIHADVEKILAKLKHPLEHPCITEELKLRLRRLELRGELTKVNIQLELERIKDMMPENHFVQLREDIEKGLAKDAWVRRFFRGTMAADDDAWRVPFLTPSQNLAVSETIRRSMQRVQDLGSASWWANVKEELKSRKVKDVDRVMDSIHDKVDEYKTLAIQTTPPAPDAEGWIPWFNTKLHDWLHCCSSWWRHQFDATSAVSEKATSSYAVVAAHAKSAELAVSSIEAHAKQQAKHLKQSFAQYWLEKEKKAWARVGYTEKQIQWLYDHLEKAFKNKADLAKNDIDNALHTVRLFLQEARVQSATQIEHQITRIQRLLEVWKQALPTDP